MQTEMIHQILGILHQHRRRQPDNCQQTLCQYCQESLTRKITLATAKNKPLLMVLPAFPAKSSNRSKTLGHLPDFGEVLALKNLNQLCADIQKIYTPGAKLVICSDGRVFSHLVGVNEQDVSDYQAAIHSLIQSHHLVHLSVFGMDDYYPQLNYTQMREQLIEDFGVDLDSVKQQVSNTREARDIYNGMHRFIVEDQLSADISISKNQIRKRAKITTYQLIQHSNAWSGLVKAKFPNAIRLSIHPQACGSEKMGINLISNNDGWATPWHNTLLKINNRYQLVKRHVAEKLGAQLISINGTASHFQLEENSYAN